MSAIELPAPPATEEADAAVPTAGKAIAAMGAWMAFLGAVRLAGEVFAYLDTHRETQDAGLIAARGWFWFLGENPPVAAAIFAWPMILGIWLWRTRSRELVRAGALTFLVLAIGGALTTVAGWSPTAGTTFRLGSFPLPKAGWDRLPAMTWAGVIAGLSQLSLELLTGIVALVLAARGGGEDRLSAPDRDATARRSRVGRLALYASAAFLVLTIRLPAGTAFIELLSQSQVIREFLLRDDFTRLRAVARRPMRPGSAWFLHARDLLNKGERSWYAGKFTESAGTYKQLIDLIDGIPTAAMDSSERLFAARALNNWAWLLATCPRAELRDREGAVRYARRSLELSPNDAAAWNTLGVAYFRLESWDDALSSLYRSMDLSDEGGSSDWFFLAMIHHRLGHEARAREWYDKAVKAVRTAAPYQFEELYRFETEAATALGLPKPDRPPAPVVRRYPYRRPPGMYSHSGRRGRSGSISELGPPFEVAVPPGPLGSRQPND